MRRQYLSRLRVKLYFLVHADINLCEVVAVEALTENLSIVKNIVLLKLLLSAEDIPCGVQLLVLATDGLDFLLLSDCN